MPSRGLQGEGRHERCLTQSDNQGHGEILAMFTNAGAKRSSRKSLSMPASSVWQWAVETVPLSLLIQ